MNEHYININASEVVILTYIACGRADACADLPPVILIFLCVQGTVYVAGHFVHPWLLWVQHQRPKLWPSHLPPQAFVSTWTLLARKVKPKSCESLHSANAVVKTECKIVMKFVSDC